MRYTRQSWKAVTARLELVVGGFGQTGLNPTVAIQRLSDSQWLAAGGGSWAPGFATNPLVEIDAANQPGMYEYAVPGARLDFAASQAGYRLKYAEAGLPATEYEYLTPEVAFSGLIGAGLATAGGPSGVTLDVWAPPVANVWLDMLVTIVDGTGGGQSRRIVGYSAARVANVAPDWGTNPDATSVCVVHAGGAADLRGYLGLVPPNFVSGRFDADMGGIQPAPRDAIADQVWDEVAGGHNAPTTTGAGLNSLTAAIPATVLVSAEISATTGTTTTLLAPAVATSDFYKDSKLVIIKGVGQGQERMITGYTVGRVAAHAAWTTNPTPGASTIAVVPALPVLTVSDIMTASMSAYETAGTFGNHVNRILRLRQENMRVVYTAWSTHGQPTAGYVLAYASSADLATDVGPAWALAKGRYDFAATYDGDLQLTGYQSVRTL